MESHNVHEFVLALYLPSLLYFIHCQGGIFIGTGAKWNEVLPSRAIHAGTLWELPLFFLMRTDFLPLHCACKGFLIFSWPCQFHSSWSHSPTPWGTISSDLETWWECSRMYLTWLCLVWDIQGTVTTFLLKAAWREKFLTLSDTQFHYLLSLLVTGILFIAPWKISIIWIQLFPLAVHLISGYRMNHLLY